MKHFSLAVRLQQVIKDDEYALVDFVEPVEALNDARQVLLFGTDEEALRITLAEGENSGITFNFDKKDVFIPWSQIQSIT
jgi:hypothetical protein